MRALRVVFWSLAGSTLLASAYILLFHPEFGGPFSSFDDEEFVLIERGENLYEQKGCETCHGSQGRYPNVASYPVLAGQPKLYLRNQLRDIRDGHRNNGLSSQMRAATGPLSDEEITALSHYLHAMD